VGNLPRVLPPDLGAVLVRATWKEPRVFAEIQRLGSVAEDEMDQVFNRGVGMALVVDVGAVESALAVLNEAGQAGVVIGEVADGGGVRFV
jgi:phosphoribosylformylglycinamidine cyclo-ligase